MLAGSADADVGDDDVDVDGDVDDEVDDTAELPPPGFGPRNELENVHAATNDRTSGGILMPVATASPRPRPGRAKRANPRPLPAIA